MRSKIFLSLACCIFSFHCYSYSDPLVTSKDLKNLAGCWSGSLTYLDYTSNKPFSMPANMVVKDFNITSLIICSLLYPKEPKANSPDTIFISKDGRFINNELIKRKSRFNRDSLEIVTETAGIDGNDHKPALIRHTYILGRNTYRVRKEVQFSGGTAWILRNEYKFMRMNPCNL